MLMIGVTNFSIAGNYKVPYGFKLIKNSYGSKMYKKTIIQGVQMYAVVVDMDKANIEFDTLDHVYAGKYERKTMKEWWNNYSNYSTFAMVNGQFFDYGTPSKLAFPLKANGRVIPSYTDKGIKRSLLINNNGKVYIRNGYSKSLLKSSNVKDMLVGLSPLVSKKKWSPIGRNYIGGIPRENCNPSKSSCDYKYLIFFIGEQQSQPNMLMRVKKWGVKEKSIVMMDGSASSQLISGSTEVYGHRYPVISKGTKRAVPHVITINKW